MVSLQKNILEKAPIKGFEETYKSAYSHGLEAIYALESVDIKSVRPLQDPISNTTTSKKKFDHSIWVEDVSQLEFDFGVGFREWVEPFALAKRSQRIPYIDYEGWIRSLAAELGSKKKLFVLFEEYQLSSLLTLTPMEMMEVRRLIPEKRKAWKAEILSELSQPAVKKRVGQQALHFVEAFIKPWLWQKRWFATRGELLERLERLGENEELTRSILKFIDDVWGLSSLFFDSLSLSDGEHYCLNSSIKRECEAIKKVARTYFYKAEISYSFDELVRLISRECALYWIGFPEGFIEKVLKASSFLIFFKSLNGNLTVK